MSSQVRLLLTLWLLGFHVIATVRIVDLLDDLGSRGLSAVQLDVTDEASIAACREEVGRITNGKLDILMNNALVP